MLGERENSSANSRGITLTPGQPEARNAVSSDPVTAPTQNEDTTQNSLRRHLSPGDFEHIFDLLEVKPGESGDRHKKRINSTFRKIDRIVASKVF